MSANDTCILACETLKPEYELVAGELGIELPVYWIESGKHDYPDRLREAVAGALSDIPPEYGIVLLLFGFCGNAMVGIESGARTLVMPKAADCIPIFLGSQKRRDGYGARRYFYTRGYYDAEKNTASDHNEMVKKYGYENACLVTREMLKHYEHLSIVDTGAFDIAYVADGIAELSAVTGIPVDVIGGDLRLIRLLIEGAARHAGDAVAGAGAAGAGADTGAADTSAAAWPSEDFYVFPPGTEITLEDSLALGGLSQA
jgi:hypothetical protein